MKDSTEKKDGLIRGNVLGKRGNENARSVITPDPWLRHDEVGVPDVIADKLCVPEPVNPWSRAHGGAVTARHPLRVLTEQHQVRLLAAGESLPDGCTLMRPLQDGDYVLLGRQPTMSNHSMCGYKLRRVPGQTLRFHPNGTVKFNADFDGDEMNILVPGSTASEAEVRCLAAVDRSMLSEATSRPTVGAHQVSAHLLDPARTSRLPGGRAPDPPPRSASRQEGPCSVPVPRLSAQRSWVGAPSPRETWNPDGGLFVLHDSFSSIMRITRRTSQCTREQLIRSPCDTTAGTMASACSRKTATKPCWAPCTVTHRGSCTFPRWRHSSRLWIRRVDIAPVRTRGLRHMVGCQFFRSAVSGSRTLRQATTSCLRWHHCV